MTATASLALPLSCEAYAHCFLTFRRHSTEWLATLQWCQESLAPQLPRKPHFAVLSVGAGNGDFDRRFVAVLQARQGNLEYVMLEPNEAMCGHLQRLAESADDKVHFEINSLRFENFVSPRRFDLVHLTHCLYYLPDRTAAIDRALQAIGPDGRVLILHQTPWGIAQVQQRFLKRLKGSDHEMFTSRDIQQILEKRRIPYRLQVLPSHINISECFQPGSSDGEALLSFFLESDVRGLDQDIKTEIVAYLDELSFSHQNRRLLYHPVAVFFFPDGP